MQHSNEAFSKKLRELRKGKKLTQEKLGKEIGVSNQVICAWENGNSLPDDANVAKLERFFGTQFKGMITRPSGTAAKNAKPASSAAAPKASSSAKNAPNKKQAPAQKTAPAAKTDTKQTAQKAHTEHKHEAAASPAVEHAPAPQADAHKEPIAHDDIGEYTPAIAIYAIVADSAREDAKLFTDTYKSMVITMLEGALAEFKK